MKGYRNIVYDPRSELIRLFTWDSAGNRIAIDSTYNPYIYVESKGSTDATSIFNTALKKKSFKNQFEKSKYIKEVGLTRIFENLSPAQQFLCDNFWEVNETPEFSQFPIKIYYLDIETYSPDEFPIPEEAKHPVNVITIYDSLSRRFITWGIKPHTSNSKDQIFHYCKTEKEMFDKFLTFMQNDPPDVLLGWNSILFDLPYIINRVKVLFGEEEVGRLSPTGRVYFKTLKGTFGRQTVRWFIDGVSCLDYLDIYKRFCMVLRASYKLNSIAKIELDEQKIDYGETNLSSLADENWSKFVEYNVQDVRLLVKMEEKLQYFELLRSLSYFGLTTFEAAMGSMSVIIGACAVRARYRDKKIPTFIRGEDDGSQNEGAYVSEPQRGFQKNIVTFDANSLYPSVMITLNLSPETKMGIIEKQDKETVTIRDVSGRVVDLSIAKFAQLVKQEKLTLSKAKVLFSQKTKGIIPEMVDHYYKLRVQIRKELSKVNRQISTLQKGTPEYKTLKDQQSLLNIRQHTIKIFINSVYGALGNKVFPLGDDDLARSITLTGQAVIKQSNKILDNLIAEKLKVKNMKPPEEYSCVIYNDTDSVHASLSLLVDSGLEFMNNDKISKHFYDEVMDIENHLNVEIKKWCEENLNTVDSRIVFKRETICDVALYLQKKRYVLHILDEEGITTNKFKYTGVEIARTTMPAPIKPLAKKIVETMLLTQSQVKTNEVVDEAYRKFKELPVADISFVMGLKGYEKYSSRCEGFKTIKSMPLHVKAAYFHNTLCKTLKMSKKYELIASGDKIRFFYVKQPNKYGISAVAYKYYYPEEFNTIFEPDVDLMFDKILYSAVERFYEAVNWTPRKPGEAMQCDLFELLA